MKNTHAQQIALTPRRRAPEEKRKLILEAARDLFSRKGFEETFVGEVAKRAGVSEGIVFHHFGTKRDLFKCLAEQYGQEAAEASLSVDWEELDLEAAARRAFDFADQEPLLYRMFVEGEPTLGDPQLIIARTRMIAAFREFLEHHMKRERIRPGDPKIMAELQLSMITGAYRSFRESGDPKLREKYLQEAVRCLKLCLEKK
jgi:AcrR family transcriptional regulator